LLYLISRGGDADLDSDLARNLTSDLDESLSVVSGDNGFLGENSSSGDNSSLADNSLVTAFILGLVVTPNGPCHYWFINNGRAIGFWRLEVLTDR
tara:strand:+ start:70 stop:354 length:285 start_codon:yes stop_codon:yes gene_type:complete